MQGSPRAKQLRQQQTLAEQQLWQQIRDRRLACFKFRRQLPIGPYVADFVCMSARLIVELDGGQHATQVEHDRIRTEFLRREGFEVIRFWNNDVLNNMEGVLMVLLEALKKPSPRPSP